MIDGRPPKPVKTRRPKSAGPPPTEIHLQMIVWKWVPARTLWETKERGSWQPFVEFHTKNAKPLLRRRIRDMFTSWISDVDFSKVR